MKTKVKQSFKCAQCGHLYAKWQGRCDLCESWNTLAEVTLSARSTPSLSDASAYTRRLRDVLTGNSDRVVTGIGEFNRVMGGGIVRDSVTIISARPGAGKSTLLLQVAQDVALQGFEVLYASGEESDSQIKKRAERILPQKDGIHDNIWIYADTSFDKLQLSIQQIDPALIILDSIQTFTLEEHAARPGSPTQTLACASQLVKLAKDSSKPRAVIIVGQMNKDDEIAGLRALEHLVDTVLIIDDEGDEELKILTASKNRYGSTGEMGFFSMTEQGMLSIENPYDYFMTQREKAVSGSALTVIREGSRAIILEVESLISTSQMPYPSRICESMRRELLHTLISILEQRGGLKLFDKNVVVKSAGSMRLKDPAANLAVIMSMISSARNKSLSGDIAFVADVGLTGELKRVPALESRLRELDRMQFKRVYIAKGTAKLPDFGVEVVMRNNLQEVISDLIC